LVFHLVNLGSDTNGTSNDAQGERFSTHELSSSSGVISSRDTTSSCGTISSRGIISSCGTTSCGTTPSRGITPSCGATSSLGVDGLSPPVHGRIYSPRDEPVPSRQANTAHASESATINSPATAPTAAPIAPSALAATRLRDTHGPVAPPDPPWTPTTTSLISEQGARLPLSYGTPSNRIWMAACSAPARYFTLMTLTATGKLLVSGVVETVLFDTGAGRSCMATDAAARMLQRGRARVVGSLRAQLHTGGGTVVDDFQLIRADLALPSCSLISVEEDFLIVPTLTAGIILLGMTFLQSNCILDLPEFSIIFAGPWQREHRISLDGRVVRCLTLVAQNDVIIPPCDPNEEEA
jgi:hypothetical protein